MSTQFEKKDVMLCLVRDIILLKRDYKVRTGEILDMVNKALDKADKLELEERPIQ